MNLKQQFSAILFFTVTLISFAQVGIGTTDPKAALDVVSTDAGFIMPRVADHTTLTVGADQTGIQVYNTTTKSIWYYDGTAWSTISTSSVEALNDLTDGNTEGDNRFVGHSGFAGTEGTDYHNRGNVVIGSNAFQTPNTDASNPIYGSDNVALGKDALTNNTTGNKNTSSGNASLFENTIGDNNTAIGINALQKNVVGSYSTAIGCESQRFANDQATAYDNFNTSVGFHALRGSSTAANNTGNHNTVMGARAMINNTTGDENTAMGYGALFNQTTGSKNTVVGRSSGEGITTGSSNTILGANVAGLDADLSNNIIIADGDGNRRINVNENGNVGIGGITSPTERLYVSGNILATGTITPDYVFEKYYEGESKLKAD